MLVKHFIRGFELNLHLFTAWRMMVSILLVLVSSVAGNDV